MLLHGYEGMGKQIPNPTWHQVSPPSAATPSHQSKLAMMTMHCRSIYKLQYILSMQSSPHENNTDPDKLRHNVPSHQNLCCMFYSCLITICIEPDLPVHYVIADLGVWACLASTDYCQNGDCSDTYIPILTGGQQQMKIIILVSNYCSQHCSTITEIRSDPCHKTIILSPNSPSKSDFQTTVQALQYGYNLLCITI